MCGSTEYHETSHEAADLLASEYGVVLDGDRAGGTFPNDLLARLDSETVRFAHTLALWALEGAEDPASYEDVLGSIESYRDTGRAEGQFDLAVTAYAAGIASVTVILHRFLAAIFGDHEEQDDIQDGLDDAHEVEFVVLQGGVDVWGY